MAEVVEAAREAAEPAAWALAEAWLREAPEEWAMARAATVVPGRTPAAVPARVVAVRAMTEAVRVKSSALETHRRVFWPVESRCWRSFHVVGDIALVPEQMRFVSRSHPD